jgi:hypothetical protein
MKSHVKKSRRKPFRPTVGALEILLTPAHPTAGQGVCCSVSVLSSAFREQVEVTTSARP